MVILDLRRGEYLLLNQVASAIWTGLLNDAMTEGLLCDSIRQQFDVEEGKLLSDISAFARRCRQEGLLVEPQQAASCTFQRRRLRAVAFPTVAAWSWLIGTALRLRRHGFAEAYSAAVDRAPEVRGPWDESRLLRAEAAFARAEMFFVSKAAPNDCLPRSLALFGFLRSLGLPAEHRIGFQRYPLSAHAWVECGGRVILDADRRDHLTTLSRSPA